MKPQEIENKIYEIRHQNVMLYFDLAEMYQTETRALKQAVRRNLERFPIDFMFELNEIEIESMVSQNVIPSKQQLGGAKPFAFTEQGVAMLSSVLKSKIAIEINISIIRAFVLMRQYALSHIELSEKLNQLENTFNKKFNDVAEALNFLLQKDHIETEQKQRKPIGYKKQ
ncbi:ORF6N domain-containing protein [Gelidibacter algens]|uniref:ORF6N domain-containing protein n=1 Tax=Gelidibacter algens TaxID=49280 RepID=A0A327SBB0_9FLAO|nr:ORF6N domain-containing protein [Gelidibacter algens]RAJ25935.1 ORF6N domain-containing protein [Gelidibacter algens]